VLRKLLCKQRHSYWQNIRLAVLLLFFVLFAVFGVISHTNRAEAVTSSTLNFQGRLLSGTGALVPDGVYTIEFKIYDSVNAGSSAPGVCSLDSSSDDCWLLETRSVSVQNGYFSVYLADTADGGTAFTAGLPWDQELWMTMNVDGDGEMTPRFKLTAVTYAFSAGAVQEASGNAFTGDELIKVASRTPH